ncbi:hypothetical protein JCM11251_006124 [Rhodosporidiobolus azoricus]
MPPRSRAAPASASSFLDLKAQISKHESDFTKSKQLGQSTIAGGVPRGGGSKKLPTWARQNKGLAARSAKDQVVYEDEVDTGRGDPEKIKAQLERKAAIYDKIRKGKTGGLSEDQIGSLLVDFDRKTYDNPDTSDDDSAGSDVDESLTVPDRRIADSSKDDDDEPGPSLPYDPLVEYTDEFGRTRMIPRSEVPRGAPFRDPTATAEGGGVQYSTGEEAGSSGALRPGEGPEASNIIYGDQTSFPVYEPDPSILAKRAATLAAAAAAPLVDHYDASEENRQRGAGFYAFSGNEEERKAQMETLKKERVETERKRRERDEEGDLVKREREREKEERKRKIEEKRREVEARRKRAKAE